VRGPLDGSLGLRTQARRLALGGAVRVHATIVANGSACPCLLRRRVTGGEEGDDLMAEHRDRCVSTVGCR
jgi:hypothetical protein